MSIYLYAPLCGNIASSTTSEVYSTYCFVVRGGRSHARPRVTRVDNFVKFGHVAFDLRPREDRQTDCRTQASSNRRRKTGSVALLTPTLFPGRREEKYEWDETRGEERSGHGMGRGGMGWQRGN